MQDPEAEFPPGKVVAGKVLAVAPSSKGPGNRSSSGELDCTVSLSLRPSAVLGDRKRDAVEALEVGQAYRGRVHKVEAFGVFVKFEDKALGDVVGLCHISEAADRCLLACLLGLLASLLACLLAGSPQTCKEKVA